MWLWPWTQPVDPPPGLRAVDQQHHVLHQRWMLASLGKKQLEKKQQAWHVCYTDKNRYCTNGGNAFKFQHSPFKASVRSFNLKISHVKTIGQAQAANFGLKTSRATCKSWTPTGMLTRRISVHHRSPSIDENCIALLWDLLLFIRFSSTTAAPDRCSCHTCLWGSQISAVKVVVVHRAILCGVHAEGQIDQLVDVQVFDGAQNRISWYGSGQFSPHQSFFPFYLIPFIT